MASEPRSRVPLATMTAMANSSRSSRSRHQQAHNSRHSKKRTSLDTAPASSQQTAEFSLEPVQMAPALAQRLNPALIVETACGMDLATSRSRGESRRRPRQSVQRVLLSSVLGAPVEVPVSQRPAPTITGQYRNGVATLKMLNAAYDHLLPGRNRWRLKAPTGSAEQPESSLENGAEHEPHRHSSRSGRLRQQRTPPTTTWSLLLTCLLLTCLPSPGDAFECDRMFISTPEGARNGTFSAPHMDIVNSGPTIPANANGGSSVAGGGGPGGLGSRARQCIYTFIAQPGERVDVTFTTFRVRGSPPDDTPTKGWAMLSRLRTNTWLTSKAT